MKRGRFLDAVLRQAEIDVDKLVHAYVSAALGRGLGVKGMAEELAVSVSGLAGELRRRGIKLTRKVSLSIEA